MDYELKERITQIRNALTLIWNIHQSEFTFYEGIKLDQAYWALVDIFDKRKEAEFDAMGEEVKSRIKKYGV
jgi:hypothetical protein